MLTRLDSWESKNDLMKKKSGLRGTIIRVEHDYTNREKEVMRWIQNEVEKAWKLGTEAWKGYMRWIIGGWEYVWNLEERKI